jgi:hypothetical protein
MGVAVEVWVKVGVAAGEGLALRVVLAVATGDCRPDPPEQPDREKASRLKSMKRTHGNERGEDMGRILPEMEIINRWRSRTSTGSPILAAKITRYSRL